MKRKSLSVVLGVIAGLLASAPGFAQGDGEAGAAKVATCIACHGQDGISISAEFPSLAGQVPGYIEKQLRLYKSGERQNPIMAGMVASLSEQDMADIDAYYSSLEAPVLSLSEDQVEEARRGEKLYRGGYRPFDIAACMACHGPGGHGIPPVYPRVSGQQAEYLETQLLAFKSGAREHEIMNPIAFRLSESQIRELALYMSALN